MYPKTLLPGFINNRITKLTDLFPEEKSFEFRMDDKHAGYLYSVNTDTVVSFCTITPHVKIAGGFNYPLEVSICLTNKDEVVLETEYSSGVSGDRAFHLLITGLHRRNEEGNLEPINSFRLSRGSFALYQLGIYEPAVEEVKKEELVETPKPIPPDDDPIFTDFKL